MGCATAGHSRHAAIARHASLNKRHRSTSQYPWAAETCWIRSLLAPPESSVALAGRSVGQRCPRARGCKALRSASTAAVMLQAWKQLSEVRGIMCTALCHGRCMCMYAWHDEHAWELHHEFQHQGGGLQPVAAALRPPASHTSAWHQKRLYLA